MKRVSMMVLAFLMTIGPATTGLAASEIFRAELSGRNEIPKVRSPAKGELKLIVTDTGVSFELNVDGIMNPMEATIQKGRVGENGPPLVGLFGGSPKIGMFSGILAEGVISERNLLGELQGKTVADLVRLIRSGDTYVNVFTNTFPDGEIRGQIR